jgi:alpha-1,2-mannosyltransferase
MVSANVRNLLQGRAVQDTPAPISSLNELPQHRPVPPALAASLSRPSRALWKTAGLCVLGFVLVLYNAVNLGMMIELSPKNDFGRTFLSAVAFVRGGEMYGRNESIPWELEDGSTLDLWNLNPPHFHLLLLPLAWLPIGVALLLWLLANAAGGYFAFRLIAREAQLTLTAEQRQVVLLGSLAFIGMTSALVTGHMSFLLFWLVTFSWHAARHERWAAAGAWLGLGLSVKPFLLFLVPYFLWRRQWRGLAAMGATVLLCVALGFAVFGVENHRAWRHMLEVADNWGWLPMNASIMAFLSRTFTANPVFTPVAIAAPELLRAIWLGVGIPMGVLTYAATFRDSSRRGLDRAFAMMLVASLLLSPLGWTYYFWLPLGPLVLLFAEARGRSESWCSPWTRRLLKTSLVGLMYPLWCISFFQPSPVGTLLISSLYFWGLLLVWLALLLDGLRTYFLPRPALVSRTSA